MFEIETRAPGLISQRQRNARAKAANDKPSFVQKTADTYDVWSINPGSGKYEVRFLRSDDKVFASCECEAGQNGNPCYHAMRVYDFDYSKRLMSTGVALLTASRSVGDLGFIGNPVQQKPATVLHLVPGQSFTANRAVRLSVEPE